MPFELIEDPIALAAEAAVVEGLSWAQAVATFEAHSLARALRRHGPNRERTAAALQLTRSSFFRRLARYQQDRKSVV